YLEQGLRRSLRLTVAVIAARGFRRTRAAVRALLAARVRCRDGLEPAGAGRLRRERLQRPELRLAADPHRPLPHPAALREEGQELDGVVARERPGAGDVIDDFLRIRVRRVAVAVQPDEQMKRPPDGIMAVTHVDLVPIGKTGARIGPEAAALALGLE